MPSCLPSTAWSTSPSVGSASGDPAVGLTVQTEILALLLLTGRQVHGVVRDQCSGHMTGNSVT
jgi:hypothetical protein